MKLSRVDDPAVRAMLAQVPYGYAPVDLVTEVDTYPPLGRWLAWLWWRCWLLCWIPRVVLRFGPDRNPYCNLKLKVRRLTEDEMALYLKDGPDTYSEDRTENDR